MTEGAVALVNGSATLICGVAVDEVICCVSANGGWRRLITKLLTKFCELVKKTPYPPRTTVLSFALYANPRRGAKLLRSASYSARAATPSNPRILFASLLLATMICPGFPVLYALVSGKKVERRSRLSTSGLTYS